MERIKVAVVGYGNIGKYSVEAILASPDMELAGVVRRDKNCALPAELNGVKVTDDISTLGKVDVAILATPTRSVMENAKKYLSMGINTVDSYDTHGSILELRSELMKVAQKYDAVSIISAGWDPGTDSIIRTVFEASAPKGITYTNFGPGMSMGHTVAAKAIEDVEGALSITIPLGAGIHRRMVYVKPKLGADFAKITSTLKSDAYFSHDETHVIEVSDIDKLTDVGHGVNMIRKGVSGATSNQIFEFNMKINNPALTSQILVASARAAMKQKPGAYTLIEIPVIDLCYGERDELIKKLV